MRIKCETPAVGRGWRRTELTRIRAMKHGSLLADLIVEDWGYLKDRFLGFFILFRCRELGWF